MQFPFKAAYVKDLACNFWASSLCHLLLIQFPRLKSPEIKQQSGDFELGKDLVWTLVAFAAIAILLAIFFMLKEKGKLNPI